MTYIYVRNWFSGKVVRFPTIEGGDFLLFERYLASDNLPELNKFWEIVPEEEVEYVGDPPTLEVKRAHIKHFWKNYRHRRRFLSVEEFLNRNETLCEEIST